MNVCVTTWYDDAFAPLGDLALGSLVRYAARQRYEFRWPAVAVTARPPAWHKIRIVESLFDAGVESVFWVDADAVIVRPDVPVHEMLPAGKDLGLVLHEIDGRTVPNTGVMLWRNSEWSRRLLRDVWERDEYLRHRWWENAAFCDVLGFHAVLGTGDDRPDAARLAKIERWPTRWNHLPGATHCDAPIVRHYAGKSWENRLANMRADVAEGGAGASSSAWKVAAHGWRRRFGRET